MLFGTPPAAGLRHRRPGRGGLFAGQVRHPDRAAAALAAGQGQRLDRGPDDRLDHPGRAAGRPAGRADACRAMLLGFDLPLIDTGIDTAPEAAIAVLIVCCTSIAALFNLYIPRTEAPLQPHAAQPAGAGARLLRSCNARAVARQAGPDLAGHDHAVLGRRRATCASSCSPGPRRRWATAPRRPRRWSAWWRSARRSGAVVASMRMRLDQATARDPAGHRAWACW